MAKLSQEDILSISDLHRAIQFYGTPEKGYTDSGLWMFLDLVFTNDNHDDDNPIKKLPVSEKPHLIIFFLYMLACKQLFVPKSRQMMITWAKAAFVAWHAMSAPLRYVIHQTQTEEDAFDNVTKGSKEPTAGRMDFIIQHLPEWLIDPNIKSGRGNKAGQLVFSLEEHTPEGVPIPWHGSRVLAVAGGANKVRGKTLSLFDSDEAAFQDDFAGVVRGMRAALGGSGKFIAVSTVDSGSTFNEKVLEGIDEGDPVHSFVPEEVQKALAIMGMEWPKGLKSWKTPSGLVCLEIHYTSDPEKDPKRNGAAWIEQEVAGYDGGFEGVDWLTEMEIKYNAGGGNPVFPYLSNHDCPIFIPSIKPEEAIRRFDLYAGYDFGANNPAAFIVWGVNEMGHIYALWELYEVCENLGEHAARIKACPYWKHLKEMRCDPSMMSKTQITASGNQTIAEQFAEHGVNFTPGRRGQDAAVAVRFKSEYWSNPYDPAGFITADCPNLIVEARGLRWQKHPTRASAKVNNNPEKIIQKHNHAWDATALCIDARPNLWIPQKTPKRVSGRTFDDLMKKAEGRQRQREGRNYGINVV